jgi:pimeloyl-ACP methyl ester carboxylesterase
MLGKTPKPGGRRHDGTTKGRRLMAEPLVLVPGLMADALAFQAQVVSLSRAMPVMVAAPTQGERIEEIASDILSALPARFALAGHGFGGMVALELLRRAPERVTRLALMDTTPLPGSPQEAADREALMIAARSGRLDDVMRTEIPSTCLAPGAGRVAVTAQVLAMARALGPQVYLRQARALQRRKDQQVTLRKIKQPTLILCGEHDSLMPLKRHSFMAELIPFARLEVVADAGHLPMLEQPQALTEALQEWLRQPLVPR